MIKLECSMKNAPDKSIRWPYLYDFVRRKFFSEIDYFFANKLLDDSDEDVAAVLCYLMASAQNGHLCVTISDDVITPNPLSVLNISEDNDDVLTAEEQQRLSKMILSGKKKLPSNITADVSSGDATATKPLCLYDGDLYLQRHWIYETMFLDNISRIMKTTPAIQYDENISEKLLSEMCNRGNLLDEQVQAIRHSLQSCFTVIVGGPGTGKTYTARKLIDVIQKSLSSSADIVLAAPTGKAVANLKAGIPDVKAMTIHALLGIGFSRRYRKKRRIDADIIIVDECSMVDVRLMAELLDAVADGTRLIIIGDNDQLPPVEAGSVFADLVESHENSDAVVRLKKCLRTESVDIVAMAQAVNSGNVEDAVALLQNHNVGDDIWSENPRITQEKLLRYVLDRFPKPRDIMKLAPEELLTSFKAFCMLSPLRRGHLGVDALNNAIMSRLYEKAKSLPYFVAPIMITTNDYNLGMMNGDVGVMTTYKSGIGSHAIFPGNEEQRYYDKTHGIRKIPAIVLPRHEYSYCVSVHKSQGSEYDDVLLVMPQGAEYFGREILYTAITRARKKIEILGDKNTISATIQTQSRRHSGILRRF